MALLVNLKVTFLMLQLVFGPAEADRRPIPRLVRDFPGKLEQIRKKQREYREQWRKANKPEARKQVRLRAKQFVVRAIVEDIFPAWMGTPWHMGHDDDASMPHQPGKRVSCSYFVTAVLQNVGLHLDSRSRWANSRALHIQYSLASGTRNIHRYGSISPKELSTRLVGLKPGLYLIGLNCHIGFILIADGRARFIHSNYVDPEEGVTDETVAESRAIANSQKVGYWVSPLFQDDRLIEYWLTGREVPLQKADASLIRGKKYSMSSRKVNRMLSAARELLGVSYQMGGRLREPGEGIDCQGLIYYAAERISRCGWKSYSTKPTDSVVWEELGGSVPGFAPVSTQELDLGKLNAGDIILCLASTENPAEPSIGTLDTLPVWVWHTGMYTGEGKWIHADAYSGRVVEENLKAYLSTYMYDGIFVTRMKRGPNPKRCRKHKPMMLPVSAKPAWPQEGVSLTPPEIRFPKGFGRHRIYLDAGHGSSGNTGTTSAFCESEQDHNIRVANHLARYLDNTGHFQVRVSRKGDQRVSYRRRLKQATRWNAEVFVSLHSDARGSAEWWSPVAGKICLRNFNDPGFSVLWSDEGSAGLISRRYALACAIASRMQAAGFLPYDGNDYIGLYEDDPKFPGVFVDRHQPGRRIFFLRKPSMPSVIIETHHALDPREERRWREEKTLQAFGASLAAALSDFLGKPVKEKRPLRFPIF